MLYHAVKLFDLGMFLVERGLHKVWRRQDYEQHPRTGASFAEVTLQRGPTIARSTIANYFPRTHPINQSKDYEQLLVRNDCVDLVKSVERFGAGHEFTKLCALSPSLASKMAGGWQWVKQSVKPIFNAPSSTVIKGLTPWCCRPPSYGNLGRRPGRGLGSMNCDELCFLTIQLL